MPRAASLVVRASAATATDLESALRMVGAQIRAGRLEGQASNERYTVEFRVEAGDGDGAARAAGHEP